MTGMGADGLSGARAVHERGGVVLAQDRASSAVWGMPGRVAAEGIASSTLPLAMMAAEIKRRVGAGRPAVSALTTLSLSTHEVIYGML
jgi:two-component system, chemotaxis family, protein-glutamate methylesterase/glutaminase